MLSIEVNPMWRLTVAFLLSVVGTSGLTLLDEGGGISLLLCKGSGGVSTLLYDAFGGTLLLSPSAITDHGFPLSNEVLAAVALGETPPSASPARRLPGKVSDEEYAKAVQWLEEKARALIRASARPMHDGTTAFLPQAGSHYNAFWLRDYAYMLEGCPEAFSHEEVRRACLTFVAGIGKDGSGVDCIRLDGTPIYKPGGGTMGENPVTDGGPFTVDVAWRTYQILQDRELLSRIIDRLEATMQAVPRNPETGLVHIDPKRPYDRCPYGFTDTVRKTGDVLFTSLLDIRASRQMADLYRALDRQSDAERWSRSTAVKTEAVRQVFWGDELGLFLAATVRCRQPDIWGSAFAVHLDVATPQQADRIAAYFVAHYEELVQRGCVRHLPGGMYWEMACPPETYQNGGYWGVATGWFAEVLARVDRDLAKRTLFDLIQEYQQHGVNEWILNEKVGVPDYTAGAALPLASIRRIGIGR